MWSALAFQGTGYCAIIDKNLPLPIHACVQESARVCARERVFAHAHQSVHVCREQIRAETIFSISLHTSISTIFHNQNIFSEHFLKLALHL